MNRKFQVNSVSGHRRFRYEFSEEAVSDLRERLNRTRWPSYPADNGWEYGPALAYQREVVDYWSRDFDFKAAENRLNSLPQFVGDVGEVELHYVHVRSDNDDAPALVLLHGWPGSTVEFLDAIALLTHSEGADGNANPSFHVVAPSLPGFGRSTVPVVGGMTPRKIAGKVASLMRALGYRKFLVQGGDWGSLIATHLAADYPDSVMGLHLSIAQPVPPSGVGDPLDRVQAHEQRWLKQNADHVARGLGYFTIQSTRSQALAFGLNDSPAGWCAWVLDRLHFWLDCERNGVRDIRHSLSWDEVLTNISLYWLTDTISSSVRLYREQRLAEIRGEGAPGKVLAPTGVAIYPKEFVKSPRAWMEARFPVVHWYEAQDGGHFAAWEQPELFATDVRSWGTVVLAQAD